MTFPFTERVTGNTVLQRPEDKTVHRAGVAMCSLSPKSSALNTEYPQETPHRRKRESTVVPTRATKHSRFTIPI